MKIYDSITPELRAFIEALLLLALLLGSPHVAPAQSPGLHRAHAHNDYQHDRPLLDALACGFNSVEADIHLVDGELLVAHDLEDVVRDRTLERLYLAPLRARIREHGGSVHPGLPPLTLLIDVKSEGEATYSALNRVLRRYADILTIFAGDVAVEGPVVAVISGNRPRETMASAALRFAGYDGRLPDLAAATTAAPSFIPLVSDRWDQVSAWRGVGPLPEADRRRLADAVRLAHRQGRRIRFWGAPDIPAAWRVLHEAGVDLINTDDLDGLRAFLLGRR